MANAGPNTNGAQFFITFAKTEWLDGRHVVFGKVSDGQNVLDAMEKVATDQSDRPKEEILVTDCGTIDVETPYIIEF